MDVEPQSLLAEPSGNTRRCRWSSASRLSRFIAASVTVAVDWPVGPSSTGRSGRCHRWLCRPPVRSTVVGRGQRDRPAAAAVPRSWPDPKGPLTPVGQSSSNRSRLLPRSDHRFGRHRIAGSAATRPSRSISIPWSRRIRPSPTSASRAGGPSPAATPCRCRAAARHQDLLRLDRLRRPLIADVQRTAGATASYHAVIASSRAAGVVNLPGSPSPSSGWPRGRGRPLPVRSTDRGSGRPPPDRTRWTPRTGLVAGALA